MCFTVCFRAQTLADEIAELRKKLADYNIVSPQAECAAECTCASHMLGSSSTLSVSLPPFLHPSLVPSLPSPPSIPLPPSLPHTPSSLPLSLSLTYSSSHQLMDKVNTNTDLEEIQAEASAVSALVQLRVQLLTL